MSCERIRWLLGELVDGTLTMEESASVRGHLRACAACRSEELSIRTLKAGTAALPDEIEPRRDLWKGIEPKLSSSSSRSKVRRGIGPSGILRAPGSPKGAFLRPALLAASLAVVLAGAGYMLLVGRVGLGERRIASGGPIGPSAPSIPSGAGEAPGVVPASGSMPVAPSLPGLNGADLAFLEARQQLRTALYERRKSLSPETLRKVDQNLKIIENAIEEIRTAVAVDPGNRQLQRMLIATRQREVALLRHVTQTADLRSR